MELKVICKRLITQNLDENITEGEFGADIIGITVPRMYGEHDLSTFSFRLTAVSKLNESVAEQVLTMDSAGEENIHLLWEVTSDFTASSGEVTLILAGVNPDNTVQIKFTSQPVTINDDSRLEFIESPTILEQAYNQVQLEVQKAVDAAERAEDAALKPIIVPAATETEIGGVLSGGDITITENGSVTVNSVGGNTLDVSVPENAVFTDTVYTLPTASETVLGGVKVDNSSITIDNNGVISAVGTSGENGKELGNSSSYNIKGTVNYPIIDLTLHGKSIQNGTPTPEAPVDILSVGSDGTVVISCNNGSDNSVSATITSGLPLYSIKDVHDELIYNADGTGKIIKRTRRMPLSSQYNWTMSANPARFGYAAGITGADISSGYASAISEFFSDCRLYSTWIDIFTDYFADLDEFKEFLDNNDVYLIYPLATPEIIELSSAEIAELQQLQTFDGVTDINNNEDAEMSVKICTNAAFSEYIYPVIKGLLAQH